jgi:hypothetical protein
MGLVDVLEGNKMPLHELITVKIDNKELSIEEF